MPGNAKGTTWEYGQVKDINKQGALIDYSPPHGMYGIGMRVPLTGLERSSEKTVKGFKKSPPRFAKAPIKKRATGGGPIHVRAHPRKGSRGVRAHTRKRPRRR